MFPCADGTTNALNGEGSALEASEDGTAGGPIQVVFIDRPLSLRPLSMHLSLQNSAQIGEASRSTSRDGGCMRVVSLLLHGCVRSRRGTWGRREEGDRGDTPTTRPDRPGCMREQQAWPGRADGERELVALDPRNLAVVEQGAYLLAFPLWMVQNHPLHPCCPG